MNVLTFTGNLGRDCRINTVGSHTVVNFAVPATEGYGDKKKTHWVDCAYWGKAAEAVAPYLLKGQSVCVSGEVGMKDASDKYPAAMTCRVNSLTLTGGKRDQAQQPAPAKPAAHNPATDFDDDVDF